MIHKAICKTCGQRFECEGAIDLYKILFNHCLGFAGMGEIHLVWYEGWERLEEDSMEKQQ